MMDYFALKVDGGRESYVAESIKYMLQKRNMTDLVESLMIPKAKSINITASGKKRVTEKNLLTGYIIMKADVKSNSQFCGFVNTLDGVHGFLGSKGHPKPIPKNEIQQMLKNIEEINHRVEESDSEESFDYEIGDKIKIKSGMFDGFSGIIDSIDSEKKRLKVSVMVFAGSNGLTIVDLSFSQVKKDYS